MHDQNLLNGHRHWHHLLRKRRRRGLGISSKNIAIGQVLSLCGAILAGAHLDNNKAALAALAGAFVVLPGVFDLTGSLGGALSAKINHRLENPRAKILQVALRATLFAFLIALLAGTLVGISGSLIAAVFFDADTVTIFKLSLGAIMLSAVIGFPLVAILTLILRRLQINPDDIMGPIESSFFDLLTVITIVTVAGWLT